MNNVLSALKEHLAVMQEIEIFVPVIEKAADRIYRSIEKGGKIFWMGNGGSAADAQHLAAELIGRFTKERRALPSLSLSTDTSVLTCLSNDYDFSIVFSRQLEALCGPNDVVVGLSTSGNSRNVIAGIETAKKIGAFTIGLSGEAGKLGSLVDLSFPVPSKNTARIQEAHIFIGHMICELVEQYACATVKEVEAVCA